MGNRVIRTKEQRLADDKAKVLKQEQGLITEAVALREQAEGWRTRSAELLVKAEGADSKSDDLVRAVGQDPDKFWAEHSNGKKAE